MNIAIILASGVGSRLTESKIPKQFLEIEDKPIIIYTINRFFNHSKIDQIIVVCKDDWINYGNQLITKYFSNSQKIKVIIGGNSRNESILKAYLYLKSDKNLKDDDIILTHDGVRMFVTDQIINNNISECLKRKSIIDTVIPTTDTIVTVEQGNNKVNNFLERCTLRNSQTPQTLSYLNLSKIFESQNNLKDFPDWDLCKLAQKHGQEVYFVEGDENNLKITNNLDLKIARILVKDNQ